MPTTFFVHTLCSATSMESSRRDLLNDMAERSSILKNNQNTHFSLKVALCSATSMESSRWDLLNEMAEHRPILENNQNTYHPRLDIAPKTGIAFPKTSFCFLLYKPRKELCWLGYFLRKIYQQWNHWKGLFELSIDMVIDMGIFYRIRSSPNFTPKTSMGLRKTIHFYFEK